MLKAEGNTQMAQTTQTEDNVAALRKDLSTLSTDVQKLMKAISHDASVNAQNGADHLKDQAAMLAERARQAGAQATAAVARGSKAAVGEVEHQIGQHPLSSVLIALGTGFVIGKLLDRH
jgi:ElaB/YqjD/DUF883 family membrane-anchored ribosome-binding protein